MHPLKELLLVSLIVIPFTGLSAGQIYKWTDSDGNVHFGETPPPEQQANEVRLPNYTAPSQPEQETGDKESDEPSDKLAEHFKKNCEVAKENLDIYRGGRRYLGSDGSLQEIDEETQAQKIKEMEEAVKKYCK